MNKKLCMVSSVCVPLVSLADAAPPPSCLGQIGEEVLFWASLIAVASLCVVFLTLRFLKRRGSRSK